MLLLTFHRLAQRLLPLRTLSAVTAAVGWSALVLTLATGEQAYSLFLRATLTVTLWALLLFAFISLFRTLPVPPLPALKWPERLLARIRIALFHLVTFAFMLLVFAVCGISLKLMMVG